jgi:hypothetical protein
MERSARGNEVRVAWSPAVVGALHGAELMQEPGRRESGLHVSDAAGLSVPADLRSCILSLLRYCGERDWAGDDPYDALNSRVFGASPFARSRICRLAFTQGLKRLPVNVRRLLLIPKVQNPKALGLFLSALLKLERFGMACQQDEADTLIERLIKLRSPGMSFSCWGYSFPWQTRTDLVPRHAPNLVCTVFVAQALLDAWEQLRDPRCFDMAVSAASYLMRELYRTADDGAAGFSYPVPGARSQIHNANLLGAALLSRVASQTGDWMFLDAALAVTRHTVSRQRPDGSWYYGEGTNQRWIDNFHTGFNLCALRAIGRYAGTKEFETSLRRGYAFYRGRFFREDGAPRYYHDRVYPIDVHAVAQSIITLAELKDLDQHGGDLAHSVFAWALRHMRDEKGYFYYQVLPAYRNRSSYMRWSQAWMLLALASLMQLQVSRTSQRQR